MLLSGKVWNSRIISSHIEKDLLSMPQRISRGFSLEVSSNRGPELAVNS